MFKNTISFCLSCMRSGFKLHTYTVTPLRVGKYLGLICLSILTYSCKKEASLSTVAEKVQWIHVLQDTIAFSTDNESILGRNGKVLTDPEDNIYTYYYSLNLDQAVISKFDPEGILIWKKTFDNCKPLDMARLNDGSILLAASLTGVVPNYLTLYSIKTDGTIETKNDTLKDFIWASSEVLNANIVPLQGNSFLVSGVWKSYISGSNAADETSNLFIVKHSQIDIREWTQYFGFCFTCPYTVNKPNDPSGASSVIQTSNGQILFQFAFNADLNYPPVDHTILTGLLNADGSADTSFLYPTGLYNRYRNGFIQDFYGDYLYHYSTPKLGRQAGQSVSAGFLRIGQDAQINDTISIPIPTDHMILSCAKNYTGFMMTAYKAGIASGSGDYSAEHTLFLTGGTDWHTTNTFYLQQFYSDYFFSNAATSDGGFISMGRIQSFNGPNNKLVLVKWKN